MSDSDLPKSAEDVARLLQIVIDNLPEFIFWKDRQSVYLGCNENFAKVAGLAHHREIVGKTDFDLPWKKEEAEFFRQVDARIMESGLAEYHIVEPQFQADGKQAWLDTNKIPLIDDSGNVVGILGTYEDITERRAEEEAGQHAKRLEAVGRLAGGVAHDFNNLLGGIIGAAEILQRRAVGTPDADLLCEILRTAERAADLTSKLLAFSRKGNMHDEVFDVHDAVENVATLVRRGLDARVALNFELDARVRSVRGDSSEIELALLNLGLNARDAMVRGGVLTIRSSNVTLTHGDCERSPFSIEPGEYVRLEVEDTGPGIPEELSQRIFEPFFTTKTPEGGTGLGLSAVYGAAQAHAGSILVTPGARGGARFVLDLPLAPPTERSRARVADGEEMREFEGLVLVVDDEELLRNSTAERLRQLGFRVETAGDGLEALRKFDECPGQFVLALLDVVMPRMGGVECSQVLLQRRPDLPIVLSSGFPRDQLVGSDQVGRIKFLKKPYGQRSLARVIAEALDRPAIA